MMRKMLSKSLRGREKTWFFRMGGQAGRKNSHQEGQEGKNQA